ncbi:MAG: CHAT domain-containing protein [Leptospira sp.]|nr:CHAT domain-containing protein [Leptospira sp.]
MLLTIRENANLNSIEFLWNLDSNERGGTKYLYHKPISECESFWRSWESLVYRCGEGEIEDKYREEFERKREWMRGLVAWGQISQAKSKNENLFIQSDTKWISLPWELLFDDKITHRASRKIIREFLSPRNQFVPVATTKAFFLFQTQFGGKLEESLEREYNFLQDLNWGNLDTKFFKNGLARVERLKEILPGSKVFYLASHLENEKWTLPDGSILSKSELESMNLSGLELVFLNGCYSAFGLAQSFLRCGAKEVIGFATSVPNSVSEIASKIFWTEWTKSQSSQKAYTKVKENLSPSIYLYSWIRFGEERVNKHPRWISNIGYATIAILFAIFALTSFYYSNFRNQVSKTENISPITSTGELNTKSEQPIEKKLSYNSHEKTSLSSKKREPIKNVNDPESTEKPVARPQENKDRLPLWDEYADELPPKFLKDIRSYIEDEAEILPKKKRILLVRRILERNQSLEWKQEVFSQETGR